MRRWEALIPTAEGHELIRRNRVGIAASGNGRLTWEPVYSRFDGTLPLTSLAALSSVKNQFMAVPPYTIVRLQFDVAGAGDVELTFNSAAYTQAWLDGRAIDIAERIKLSVTLGRHTITLAVDRDSGMEPLRCEIADLPGSGAAATPVIGK